MIDARWSEQVKHRPCSARTRIRHGVDDMLQTRVQHGPTAHGTRLERHVEGAAVEPPRAEAAGRAPEDEDLRVGRRVVSTSRRFRARATTRPSRTTTAPIGTSRCAGARRAARRRCLFCQTCATTPPDRYFFFRASLASNRPKPAVFLVLISLRPVSTCAISCMVATTGWPTSPDAT